MFLKKRMFVIIDVSLALIAGILLLHLFGFNFPSLGDAKAAIAPGEPACFYEYEREFNLAASLEMCCWEAVKRVSQKSVGLYEQGEWLSWIYYNNNGKGNIWMNSKAKVECEQLPFWIRK